MALKHNYTATGTNNGAKQVSKDRWNENHVIDTDGLDFPINSSTPAAPAADNLRQFSRKYAGRILPVIKGPSGLDTTLGVHMGRSKAAFVYPNSGAATFTSAGITPVTLGTLTARTPATTSFATRLRRTGIVSPATANNFAFMRGTVTDFTIGAAGSPAVGGFFIQIRFMISDATIQTGASMFVGLRGSTTTPTQGTAIDPAAITQCIGVGCKSGLNNLVLYYGGTTAQTPIDLGTNFPTNTTNTDVYELTLFSPTDTADVCYYRVERLNTGNVSEGQFTNTTPGTNLPSKTTLLNLYLFRMTTVATAIGIDILSAYLETDN